MKMRTIDGGRARCKEGRVVRWGPASHRAHATTTTCYVPYGSAAHGRFGGVFGLATRDLGGAEAKGSSKLKLGSKAVIDTVNGLPEYSNNAFTMQAAAD
uniref:Uncharacterized protein n=1 Tax=Oryza meridionalis TaxID=40149 RepID=A0A0E0CPI5_9ORYZ